MNLVSTFFRACYLSSFFRGSVLGPFSLGGLGARRGEGIAIFLEFLF